MVCRMMALVGSITSSTLTETDALIGVVKLDPWLEPFTASLKSRFAKAQQWIKTIDETEGGLEKFSRVSDYYGTGSSRI